MAAGNGHSEVVELSWKQVLIRMQCKMAGQLWMWQFDHSEVVRVLKADAEKDVPFQNCVTALYAASSYGEVVAGSRR